MGEVAFEADLERQVKTPGTEYFHQDVVSQGSRDLRNVPSYSSSLWERRNRLEWLQQAHMEGCCQREVWDEKLGVRETDHEQH